MLQADEYEDLMLAIWLLMGKIKPETVSGREPTNMDGHTIGGFPGACVCVAKQQPAKVILCKTLYPWLQAQASPHGAPPWSSWCAESSTGASLPHTARIRSQQALSSWSHRPQSWSQTVLRLLHGPSCSSDGVQRSLCASPLPRTGRACAVLTTMSTTQDLVVM